MPSHAPRKVFTASNGFRAIHLRTQKISLRTRILLAATVSLVAAFAIAGVSGSAADPTGGTLSVATPRLTYTSGPFLIANPSAAVPTNNGPVCDATNPCDDYNLTVNVPAGYNAGHSIKVTVSWPVAAADFDLYIAQGTTGNTYVTDAASSSDPEVAIFDANSGSYRVRIVPFAPAGQTTTTVIELVDKPINPPPGSISADTPRFLNYTPPKSSGLGNNAGEPTLGVGKPVAGHPEGRTMFIAGLETLRVTFDDCSSPARDLWEDVSAPTTSINTLDPILQTDRQTGRTFVSQLGPKSSLFAYTDNDGGVNGKAPGDYTPSPQGAGINSGVDHQTVGTGPFRPGIPDGTTAYPNAVYYASQDIAVAQMALSRDGGLTFGVAFPMYNLTQCGGLHGHIQVAPDGTVYLPNKSCGGEQAIVVSEDEGMTFTIRQVPGSTSGNNDPAAAVDGAGKLYFGYGNGDGHPRVAVSSNKGATFTNDQDVGVSYGIKNTVFPTMIAGDSGRAALAFIGTPTEGNPDDMATFKGEWHLYVSSTFDGGVTWTTVDATPNDPVQLGSICTAGTTCGEDRNLLDFIDITIDNQGRIQVGYADGCVGCTSPKTSRSSLATVARQSGGKRMYAAFDPTVSPSVPGAPRVNSVTKQSGGGVRVDWDAPDNGGSPITGYRVSRKTGAGGTYAVIATVSADKTDYIDTTADPSTQYFYKVTAVNAVGESANCDEFPVGEAGPLETPCLLPGVTIVTDPQGDALIPDESGGTQPGPASLDIRSLSIAELFSPTDTKNKAYFVLKVSNLAVLPQQARWTVFFTRQNPSGMGSTEWFVSMNTDPNPNNPGQPLYQYGHVTINPTTKTRTQSTDGKLDAGTYSPDGTIILTISQPTKNASQTALAFPELRTGEMFGNVNALTQQTVGVLLARVDDTGAGTYTLAGNASCAPNNAPSAALTATPTTGTAPLTVNFDASGSTDPDAGDTIVSYTFDFGDGSAPITRTGANAAQVSHVYQSGNYRATVRVTDSRGMTSNNAAGVNISVGEGTSGGTQRTFVSTSGNDSNTANNCSRTQPCRSFAAAISRANQNGEVVVLDSGGYGPVTISRSVTISAPAGVYAGLTAFSGAGVTVSAGENDTVTLRGLTLNGLGASTGILYTGGGALHVEECVINGFTGFGIDFAGGAAGSGSSTGGRLYVADTQIRNNGSTGVRVQTSGTAQGTTALAALERVRVDNNGGDGILAGSNAQVTIKNSVIAGNINGAGLRAASGSNVTTTLLVENCLSTGNQIGIAASGSAGASTVRVSRTTVSYNQAGLSMSGAGGSIISRGNNTVEGNDSSGNGAFSSTIPPK